MKLNYKERSSNESSMSEQARDNQNTGRDGFQRLRPWLGWWLQRLVMDDLPLFIDYVKGNRHG